MKFSAAALAIACFFSLSASSEAAAFVHSRLGAKATSYSQVVQFKPHFSGRSSLGISRAKSNLSMSYTVGIVGATGAVGKEIRQVLENRGKVPVKKLRIFGSERSAGSKVTTKYGEVEVELFDVAKARECDIVFLAVDGDFALQHAEAISAGDDGAVVIDNSVSSRKRVPCDV